MKKIFLLFVFTTASSLLTAQNIPSYVPSDSLVGWWPFNGNANDESGNGNNGTVFTSGTVTGATLTLDRHGNNNSAYLFNGTTDYIYGTINGFTNTSTSTVSAWLFYTGDAGGKPYDLYFQYGLYGYHTFAYGYNFSGTNFDLHSNCFPNPYTSINLNSAWHHVVVVDSLSTTKVYVDGTLLTSFTGGSTSNCYNNSNYFLIGGGADGQFVTGKMDNVGVWKRALSPLEINDLYNEFTCSDSINAHPNSSTFQTVPGVAYFTTEHSDTNATYQWQQNAGTGWTNLSDFGIYSGTTTDSLVLTGITSSMNGYGYRCIIDACSMDTTDVAYLTVENNIGLEEIYESIVVSPNPTSGALSINLTSAADYTLYNVAGQVVAQGKTDGSLDITTLPAGSYQLVLITEGGTTKHSVQKY